MSEEIEHLEAEEVGIETVINDKLQKANVTAAIIAELKSKYLPLKIDGLEDREGYTAVKDARKDCKKWRVLAQKICKEGRAEAVAIQKAWVSKEKEVTDEIESVENHLQKMEDDYDTQKEKQKAEEKIRHEKQIAARTQELNNLGATFDGISFVAEGVSYELAVIKESDQDVYEEVILPKFRAAFEAKEAARIAEENRLQKEREELQRQQEELKQQQEKLRLQQEEADKKERERLAEEQRKEAERLKKIYDARVDTLSEMCFVFNKKESMFKCYTVSINDKDVIAATDEDWENFVRVAQDEIDVAKKQEEESKQEELRIEVVKNLNIVRRQALKDLDPNRGAAPNLGELDDETWQRVYNDAKVIVAEEAKKKWEEDQRKLHEAVELKRQEELEQAKDKEKWEDVVTYLSATPIHEMRNGLYRAKMKSVKEFIANLK